MTIADELHRAYFGEAWHGPSLTETLRGVTADMAAARPISGAHSIWELVLHLKAWIAEADATTRGKPYESLKGDGNWPTVNETSPAAWERLLADLERAEVSLEEAVKGLKGTEDSDYLLHGIAQHHAYHGGQIALLKKAGS